MSFKKGDRVYHEHANEGSSGTVTRIEEGYIFVELDMKIHNYRQFVTKFSEDLTLLDEEHIFPVGSSVMTECGLFMGR